MQKLTQAEDKSAYKYLKESCNVIRKLNDELNKLKMENNKLIEIIKLLKNENSEIKERLMSISESHIISEPLEVSFEESLEKSESMERLEVKPDKNLITEGISQFIKTDKIDNSQIFPLKESFSNQENKKESIEKLKVIEEANSVKSCLKIRSLGEEAEECSTKASTHEYNTMSNKVSELLEGYIVDNNDIFENIEDDIMKYGVKNLINKEETIVQSNNETLRPESEFETPHFN